MKKLVTAACALVAASAFAVESANTVGYLEQELDVDNDEYMLNLAAPFKNLNTVNGSYVFTDNVFDTAAAKNDKLYVFDGDEWDLSIYKYKGSGQGWALDAADGSSATVSSVTVASGAHIMYEPVSAESAIVSGEVAASGSQVVSFEVDDNNWMFELVNPFPIATTLGDLETFCAKNDKIYTFDPEEWDLSIYKYKGTGSGWALDAADGSSSTITSSATVILEAGQGAYFEPVDSREWTVTLNY